MSIDALVRGGFPSRSGKTHPLRSARIAWQAWSTRVSVVELTSNSCELGFGVSPLGRREFSARRESSALLKLVYSREVSGRCVA
jgi:hypothetical protein